LNKIGRVSFKESDNGIDIPVFGDVCSKDMEGQGALDKEDGRCEIITSRIEKSSLILNETIGGIMMHEAHNSIISIKAPGGYRFFGYFLFPMLSLDRNGGWTSS